MTMVEARNLAISYVKALEPSVGCELVVLDSHTIEKPFGWIFFYDSRRHIETGHFRDALAGNAPIVVTRADGRVHPTGTAYPLEHYLKTFDRYPRQ
jgi:Immunity protein 35